MAQRQCKACLEYFPGTTTHFYERDGYLMRRCKTCYLAQCKVYRDTHRETRNAKASAYDKSERGKARRKAYYARNRDRINETRRRWAIRHYKRLADLAKARRLRSRLKHFQQVTASVRIEG